MYLFLPGPGLRCHTQAFSSGLRRVLLACVVRGPLSAASPVAVWALGCTRFIRGALWAPQLWAEGLAATWHVGSSQTRDRTHVPCIGRWMLNRWSTREALEGLL